MKNLKMKDDPKEQYFILRISKELKEKLRRISKKVDIPETAREFLQELVQKAGGK